jgi:hypothetical protein
MNKREKSTNNIGFIYKLSNIFKCNKCKKNNSIINDKLVFQNCLFCGNPNYIKI